MAQTPPRDSDCSRSTPLEMTASYEDVLTWVFIFVEMERVITENSLAPCTTNSALPTLTITIPAKLRDLGPADKDSMSLMSDYLEWEDFWIDDSHTGLCLANSCIDSQQVPFEGESLPRIVQSQYDTWLLLVVGIEEILDMPQEWSNLVNRHEATEALYKFRNLLCAFPGLKLEHLDSVHSTRFTRLGPCGLVSELVDATRNSGIASYFDYYPFNSLKTRFENHREGLWDTNRNEEGCYDKSLATDYARCLDEVDELYWSIRTIEEDLAEIVNRGANELPADLVAQREMLWRRDALARTRAHFLFQTIHYIDARYYGTDLESGPTTMETWQPPPGW